MAYWLFNPFLDQAKICTSIKAVSQITGVNINTLYYNFSRAHKTDVTFDNWRIIKTTLCKTK